MQHGVAEKLPIILLIHCNPKRLLIFNMNLEIIQGGFGRLEIYVLGGIFIVELFILGSFIGSFLNVCIYRLPREESVVNPPSHCMACGKRLSAIDLIPILSYLTLRGKCRYCGTGFSSRYLFVELLTGFLFALCFQVIGFGPELFKALVLLCFLIVITFIDIDYQLILDKVLLWLAGAGIIVHILNYYSNYIFSFFGYADSFVIYVYPIWDLLLGALLGGGILLAIALISGGGMGGGDVKFAAVLGFWLGWKLTLLTLFLAFLFGGIGGALLLLFRLKQRKDMIPFGPYLALAAFISMLYGYEIIRWYFNLMR